MAALKHYHAACIACLHTRAHGLYDGFSLAYAELLKDGYTDAADKLDTIQTRVVNRKVREIARMTGIDDETLRLLMRHHGARN